MRANWVLAWIIIGVGTCMCRACFWSHAFSGCAGKGVWDALGSLFRQRCETWWLFWFKQTDNSFHWHRQSYSAANLRGHGTHLSLGWRDGFALVSVHNKGCTQCTENGRWPCRYIFNCGVLLFLQNTIMCSYWRHHIPVSHCQMHFSVADWILTNFDWLSVVIGCELYIPKVICCYEFYNGLSHLWSAWVLIALVLLLNTGKARFGLLFSYYLCPIIIRPKGYTFGTEADHSCLRFKLVSFFTLRFCLTNPVNWFNYSAT